MPTLLIKNMPQELYEKLEHSAKISSRSLSHQAIVLLERELAGKNNAEQRRKKVLVQISQNRKLSEEEAKLSIQWIRASRDER